MPKVKFHWPSALSVFVMSFAWAIILERPIESYWLLLIVASLVSVAWGFVWPRLAERL